MAALDFPKTVYGPGGQMRKIVSKEAMAKLGPEWKSSRGAANPTSEFPKYLYKGDESKIVRSQDEQDAAAGWVESIREARDAKPKIVQNAAKTDAKP